MDRSVLAPILAELDAGTCKNILPLSGGDTSRTLCLEFSDTRLFLKLADPKETDLLTAESDGLSALAATATVRVPEVIAQGATQDVGWLALEWLALKPATPASDAQLGIQLASLHRVPQASFGWHRDNRIGRTPQRNTESPDWLTFFAEHRLGFQLELAKGTDAALDRLGEQLLQRFPDYFDGYQPQPSLLHGDLWGGNKGRVGLEPVIFDPAVYCGDREADVAMTSLFGGFAPEFYTAYAEAWPFADGHERRMELYRLYHVLNHVNLFGAAYLGQAISIARNVLQMA